MIARFTITAAHLVLLRAMQWERMSAETAGPSVSWMRPYGNSYVALDIAQHLGWDWPDEGGMDCSDFEEAREIVEARCMAIHGEMLTVVEIVCGRAGEATPAGVYVNTAKEYRRAKWEKSP